MKNLMNVPLNSIKKRLREIEISRAPVLPMPRVGVSVVTPDGRTKVLTEPGLGDSPGGFAGLPQQINFVVVRPCDTGIGRQHASKLEQE